MRQSIISLQDVRLSFTLYHNKNLSLKEWITDKLHFRKNNYTSNFNALEGISIEILDGDRVGIIGHNGAGKSSLLKIISRIYKPTSGDAYIQGKVVPLEIGAGFSEELTGRENILLNGLILGENRIDMLNRIDEIIQFSEIEKFIDTPVKYYSSGMRSRLAFSIATAIDPEILILDEVFAVGDLDFIDKAKTRMKSLVKRSKVMIMVSHSMSLIQDTCNRVIWLDRGKVKGDGDPKTLIAQYKQAQKEKVNESKKES